MEAQSGGVRAHGERPTHVVKPALFEGSATRRGEHGKGPRCLRSAPCVLGWLAGNPPSLKSKPERRVVHRSAGHG